MASTYEYGFSFIWFVKAANTPAQVLPLPSMIFHSSELVLGLSCTSISPLFLLSNSDLNFATASQATALSLSPVEQTAPLTPTISGFILASSSRSVNLRCPDKAVLSPSFLLSKTISLSFASGIKSNKFLPSLVRVSISHPSQPLSLARVTIHSGSKPSS